MAGIQFMVGPSAAIATSTSPKIITAIKAPLNQRVKILGWDISFAGTAVNATPVLCALTRLTNAGSLISTPERKLTTGSETIKTTGYINTTDGVAAPVYTLDDDALDLVMVHPQSGFSVRYPYGQEPIVGSEGFIGVYVLSSTTVQCVAKLVCEE